MLMMYSIIQKSDDDDEQIYEGDGAVADVEGVLAQQVQQAHIFHVPLDFTSRPLL